MASHGDEQETAALERALEAGVGYVALVASPKRGAAVLDSLDVDVALRAQVHTPAGLDIGARSPADIAISILAQMIAERTRTRRRHRRRSAIDPVCGMQVAVSEATPNLCVGNERVYFCCDGCRARYAEEHALAG